MKLARNIAQQTFFDVLQQGQLFVFSTLANILVINLLSREDYGLIGLSAGYFVIFSWVLISPEGILAQKYQQYKKELSKHISIFYTFNLIKIIFSLAILFIISLLLHSFQNTWYFAAVFALYTLSQLLIMFLGQIQFFLKIEFQQKKITGLTTVLRTLQLGLFLLLFLQPSALWYLGLLVVFTTLEICIYSKVLHKLYHFSWWYPLKDTYLMIKKNLQEFSLWNHLTNTLIRYIYEIDVVFLSFWASLVVVGNYSIALKIANLSFILPSLIQNSTILALTRIITPKKRNLTASIFIKYSALVSILQLAGFAIFGKWYIHLHTQTYVNEIYLYTFLILTGATVLNTFRPVLSYIVAAAEMKKFFILSVLPTMVFATVVYVVFGKLFSAVGLAAANILAYTFWVISMIIFAYRKLGLRLKFTLLEFNERELLKTIFRRKTK